MRYPPGMTTVVVVLIALALAVAVLAGLASRRRSKPAPSEAAESGPLPVEVRLNPGFLGHGELAMFRRLCEALPGHIVLAQVAAGQLLTTGDRRYGARNTFDRKAFDFLVCDAQGRPICVVELDGGSHQGAAAAKRDRSKDELCRRAGLPILRWPASALPKGPEIVAACLGSQGGTLRSVNQGG